MRIIARKTLVDFWKSPGRKGSEEHLKCWFSEAENAIWKKPTDVKKQYRSASILKNKRVVFNIKGNKYRLVVAIRYDIGIVFIRFIGTHKEYDNIDPEVI
ncbi:MAG: type II toxin-antitoxin system HigB family toxin [Candidatus Lindowbacteria bacterium]|nr:type II toxin-antitoxin system HigB family toxin [Candidatus Lindowbacteria bacterium]